jgi:hypothetical protein
MRYKILLEESDGKPSLVTTLSSVWAGLRSPSVAPSHLSHPLRGVRQRRDGCGQDKGRRTCDGMRRKLRRDTEQCSPMFAVRQKCSLPRFSGDSGKGSQQWHAPHSGTWTQ